MSFDPAPYLIQLPRRIKNKETHQWETVYDNYLEVKHRLVWFREKFPHGRIETEEVCVDLDRVFSIEVTETVDGVRRKVTKTGTGYARFKARVEDGEGGVATGYGTENAAEFADFVERSETRAVGRALAGLGIGTQFVGAELSEGEHIVDSPVITPVAAATNGHGHTPAPEPDAALEHPSLDHLAALRKLALTVCMDELEVYEDRLRRAMGVPKHASVSLRLLAKSMSMTAFMEVYGWYVNLEKQLAKSKRKEAPDGPQPAPAQSAAAQLAAATVEESPPVDPPAAASADASSSAPEVNPAPEDTVESLVTYAVSLGLKEDVTRRVIHLHKDLAKCRTILTDAAERNRRQVA